MRSSSTPLVLSGSVCSTRSVSINASSYRPARKCSSAIRRCLLDAFFRKRGGNGISGGFLFLFLEGSGYVLEGCVPDNFSDQSENIYRLLLRFGITPRRAKSSALRRCLAIFSSAGIHGRHCFSRREVLKYQSKVSALMSTLR